MEKEFYDPTLRDAEKQRTRNHDHDDVASGRVSAAELHHRNDLFRSFDIPNVVKDWRGFE